MQTMKQDLANVIKNAIDWTAFWSDDRNQEITAYLDHIHIGQSIYFSKNYGNYLGDDETEVVVFDIGEDSAGNPIKLTRKEIEEAELTFLSNHQQ